MCVTVCGDRHFEISIVRLQMKHVADQWEPACLGHVLVCFNVCMFFLLFVCVFFRYNAVSK